MEDRFAVHNGLDPSADEEAQRSPAKLHIPVMKCGDEGLRSAFLAGENLREGEDDGRLQPEHIKTVHKSPSCVALMASAWLPDDKLFILDDSCSVASTIDRRCS